MARFIINPDTSIAWIWECAGPQFTIGRAADNDLVLDHPSVSSSHCRVDLGPQGVVVRDVGSTAGTFIGGQLLEQFPLLPGQVFQVGEVVVQFALSEAETRSAAPAARRIGRPIATFQPSAPVSFYRALPGAFAYPLNGNGLILIAAGGAVFLLVGWLPLIGLLLTGYLFNYAKKIVAATAAGEDAVPDWPDFTNWAEDLVLPYVQLAALTILTVGPAFLLEVFLPEGVPFRGGWVVFAAIYGGLLAPMGMLALAMFDSFTALNPLALVWSIVRIPLDYAAAALAFGAVIAAYLYSEKIVGFIPVPVLPLVLAGFANLYLIIVAMRILGLLYRSKQQALGWFTRGRAPN